jgi:hypothetical protein
MDEVLVETTVALTECRMVEQLAGKWAVSWVD